MNRTLLSLWNWERIGLCTCLKPTRSSKWFFNLWSWSFRNLWRAQQFYLSTAHQSRSEQATPWKGQPKALWLLESITSLKDCKQDGQCQTLTGAERLEEQSCARNFCAMCFHSLPLIMKLPAALGGCITLTQACIFRFQSEVLPGWDYKRWSCPLSHGKWAFMYKGDKCY